MQTVDPYRFMDSYKFMLVLVKKPFFFSYSEMVSSSRSQMKYYLVTDLHPLQRLKRPYVC